MAREIKILRCPQCGSTDKTDLKPDVFQCSNCKTIYYLENDDLDININDSRVKTVLPVSKSRLPLILALVFALIMIFAFIFFFALMEKSPTNTVDGARETVEKIDPGYEANMITLSNLVEPITQRPILLNLESRTYPDKKEGPSRVINYLVFYDPLEKKELKRQELDAKIDFRSGANVRTFLDNRTYLISSPEIYELDLVGLSMRPVTREILADLPKAQEGLASLKFTEDGDGLQLMTSEDQLVIYFPIIKKSYSAEAFEKASHGFSTLLPGAKEKTYHQFTESKNEYSNYKLQLLKIKYLDNGGGPKTFQKFFIWSKSWVMGRGYQVCLVVPDLKEYRRILSHTDFTPGRNYYDPLVVYEDNSTLLIRFRASAVESAPYKLQRLNRSNGDVIWTVPLANGKDIKELHRYKNNYYSFSGQGVDLYDLDGISIKN